MESNMTPLQIATRKHAKEDMLMAQTYGKMNGTWKGCSIGCLAHDLEPDWSGDEIKERGHALIASKYYDGNEWMARLQDTIFEGLPADKRSWWHVALADAVAKRGRDWQVVMHAVHIAILRISYRTAEQTANVVQDVIDLHERAMRAEVVSHDQWSAARSAARSAAWSAWSAAYLEIAEAVLHEIEATQ